MSYDMSTPYSPFASLFTTYFRLSREQTDVQKCDTIREHLAELLPDVVEETAPFIATMLGVQLTGEEAQRVKYLQPPQVRDRVFRAVCRTFERLAGVQPVVLVFEDLHWADPTSLDLLEQLMPLTERVPLMLVGVFRPWHQEPSWRFHEAAVRDYAHRHTSISLGPLDHEGSRELVASLLHVEDLPEKVRTLILTKAEGNPFYVEEVIRSLLDSNLVVRENSHWRATRDIENIAVPDSLAGVINARLDRLDEQPRRVAQMASVIGREFQMETLAHILDTPHGLEDPLGELQRRELIREASRMPRRVYLFKHTLTHETAYASLLLSRRRELHRRVAECLEQADSDRVAEIARHYIEAREEARALPYLVEAGDRAARAYATTEAIGHYALALEVLETSKELGLARRAYEGMGGALAFGNDVPRAVENYHHMYHDAQEYGDLPMQVSALNKLGFVTALMQGQFPEAEGHLVDAERLARQCNDLPGLAELHMTYCYLRVPFGEFDQAMDHLGESARIGRDLALEEPRLFGLTHSANTLIYMTRFEEAWKTIQEARNLAEELGNRKWLSDLLALASPLYHLRNGDLDAAFQSAEEGTQLAAQIGAAEQEAYGSFMQGQISWLRGDYERAIACQQATLRAGGTAGLPFMQAVALSALGTAYLDISGEYAVRGAEFHAMAMTEAEKPLGAVMGSIIWAELAFCALAMGEMERADEYFQNGLTGSTATKYLARPPLLVGSALLELARGNPGEASELAREAREFAEERQMRHFYPLLEFADAQLKVARGDVEDALASFNRMEQLASEMGMRPLVLQARLGETQLLSASGRASEAETKGGEARAMIDEIAELFQDEDLREQFVKSATGKMAPIEYPPPAGSR